MFIVILGSFLSLVLMYGVNNYYIEEGEDKIGLFTALFFSIGGWFTILVFACAFILILLENLPSYIRANRKFKGDEKLFTSKKSTVDWEKDYPFGHHHLV